MPRWFLIVFGVILAVAIWHDVSSEMEIKDARVTPVTLEQDRISQMEADKSVLAQAQAGEAFATGQRACGEPASAACGVAAQSAAFETARSVLMDGGCMTWETSTWDPRGMREREHVNTHPEAEAACERQAQAIAARVKADAGKAEWFTQGNLAVERAYPVVGAMRAVSKHRRNPNKLHGQRMAAREAIILHVQLRPETRVHSPASAAEGDRKAPSNTLRRNRTRARSAALSGIALASRPERAANVGLTAAVAATDADFKEQLIKLIPHLRAFARSLQPGVGGDDLAQDAMLRGWKSRAHYQAGTNLKAWLFTILRNQFLSEKRRSWRSLPLDPVVAEETLVAHDDPWSREELLDVRGAMRLLPDDQREALILVGAAGLSYDEAAQITGCPVGTIKSRVSRARKMVAQVLEGRATGSRVKVDVEATQVFQTMMDEASVLRSRMESAAGVA